MKTGPAILTLMSVITAGEHSSKYSSESSCAHLEKCVCLNRLHAEISKKWYFDKKWNV